MPKDITPDAQRQDELRDQIKKHLTGQEWPEAHFEVTECDYNLVARMLPGMTPPNVGDENSFALDEVMKAFVTDNLLDRLDPVVARALRRDVVVTLVRSGHPHASTALYKSGGVGVKMDGSLMLLYFDLLGHALSLMTARREGDGTRFTVREPTPATVESAASLLWAFRNPPHGLNTADLPTISTDPYCGLDAFKTYLKLGEQFILGHELWHALDKLCSTPGRPSVREWVQSLASSLPTTVADEWADEISADIGSVCFLLSAESCPDLQEQAVAGAMIGVSFLGVLEYAYTRPSDVPDVIEPGDIDSFAMRFPNHPPIEVRCEALAERFGHVGEGVRTSEVYHAAFGRIMDGLDALSSGRCIARPYGTWCGGERASVGWFCADHGRASVLSW